MTFPVAWLISLGVLLLIAGTAGRYVSANPPPPAAPPAAPPPVPGPSPLGLLVDHRGRMSLNRFQIVLWTMLVMSTFLALLLMVLTGDAGTSAQLAEQIKKVTAIPPTLLGLMGVSAASVTMAGAVKDSKNTQRSSLVAGSGPTFGTGIVGLKFRRSWMQMIFEEEGQDADKVISITKFQNLIITLSIAAVYVAAVLNTQTYPVFDEHTVYLIGISHAGYVGGKIPDKP